MLDSGILKPPPEVILDRTAGEIFNSSDVFNIIWRLIITRKPVFIVTEVDNGRIVEKLIFENLGSEEDPIPLIVTEKVIFRSRDNNQVFQFHRCNKNPVYLININYNFLTLDPKLTKQSQESQRTFYQLSCQNNSGHWLRLIVYSDLTLPGNKISLLHEISHAHRSNSFVNYVNDLKINLMSSYDLAEAGVADGERSREPENGEILYCPFYDDEDKMHDYDYYPVPCDEFLAYHQARARDEKLAWEFALCELKMARARGVDLEPELVDDEVIEAMIHHEDSFGLGSYEAHFELCQGAPEEKKIRGVYSDAMYELREYTRQRKLEKESVCEQKQEG